MSIRQRIVDAMSSLAVSIDKKYWYEVLELLEERSGIRRHLLSAVTFEVLTPLFYASTINNTILINYFVEHCSLPVDRPCWFQGENVTPFWAAVWNNAYEAAARLLYYFADIRPPSRFGATAFMKCLSERNTQMAELVLSKRFGIHIFTEDHQTPLMFATYDENLTKLILAKDRDSLKCRDIMGNTALHYAAWYQNEKVIKLLIAEGLCLLSKNYFGKTALTITEQRNRNRPQRSLLYFYKTAKQCAVPREILFPDFQSPVSLTGCPHSGQVICAECTTLSSQVIQQICKDCPHLNTPGSGLHVYKLFSS
ncbi:26S proteasome non-ATPase regulatory subunit 10-like [Argonauta hians]